MREKRFLGLPLDVIGFSGSFLCAIHCLALPILVSIGAIGHVHLHETFAWEWLLLAVLLVVAVVSLWHSFRQVHGHFVPLIIAVVGISLILAGEYNHAHSSHFWSGIGGLFLAGSHFFNFALLRRNRTLCKS